MANVTKRVSKKGVVSYRIKASLGYDENRKQITRSITWTPDPGMTEKQIQKALEKQVFIFENSLEREPKNSRRVKFEELSEEWLGLMESTHAMKLSTIERNKGLRARTYKSFGNMYVDEITYRAIQKFIVSLSKPGVNKTTGGGLSEKTQKHYISFISDVLQYAKKCELIESNPCKDISVVKTGSKEREAYTLEEEAALLDTMNEQKVPIKYRAFVAIAIYCGFRRSEIMGLEWKDICFDEGTISVVRTSQYRNKNTGTYTDTPKTKESARFIKAPDILLDYLTRLRIDQNAQKRNCGDQWVETDRLFVQWNGLPMSPNTPYYYIQKFCKANEIPYKGLHSFRHAFATNLITSNQVDIKTVSSLLGHSQTSTTLNIYTHEVKKTSARGVAVFADLLEKARNNDHE